MGGWKHARYLCVCDILTCENLLDVFLLEPLFRCSLFVLWGFHVSGFLWHPFRVSKFSGRKSCLTFSFLCNFFVIGLHRHIHVSAFILLVEDFSKNLNRFWYSATEEPLSVPPLIRTQSNFRTSVRFPCKKNPLKHIIIFRWQRYKALESSCGLQGSSV